MTLPPGFLETESGGLYELGAGEDESFDEPETVTLRVQGKLSAIFGAWGGPSGEKRRGAKSVIPLK